MVTGRAIALAWLISMRRQPDAWLDQCLFSLRVRDVPSVQTREFRRGLTRYPSLCWAHNLCQIVGSRGFIESIDQYSRGLLPRRVVWSSNDVPIATRKDVPGIHFK